MSLFRETAKFIAWLTGSLAGIAAIFYACGYILTRSNLRLLGLQDLLAYDYQYYLQEGADFFLKLIILSSEILLSLFAVILLFAVPAGIMMLIKDMKRFTWLNRITWKVFPAQLQTRQVVKIIFAIIGLLIFYHLLDRLEASYAPMKVSNLFYMERSEMRTTLQSAGEACTREKICYWLLTGDRAKLNSRMIGLFLLVMESGVLLYGGIIVAANSRYRMLILIPLSIIFMTYMLLLPMAYGVLIKEIHLFPFHPTSLSEDETKNFYLVHKNATEFLIWDAADKKIYWFPSEGISGAVIGSKIKLSSLLRQQPARGEGNAVTQ